MRRWLPVATIGIALAVGPSPAPAQPSDVPALAPVVITGSRLAERAPSLEPSVTIIDARTIAARAPASLADLLRLVADAHVDQNGRQGTFASLYLRGADPSHTLVLIDGIRVNDATDPRGGGADLSWIDVSSIERIEVRPGASSALYGADALAGVVNIVTRRPSVTGARVVAGAGSSHFAAASVAANAGTDPPRPGGVTPPFVFNATASMLNDGNAGDDGFRRLRAGQLAMRSLSTPIEVDAQVRGQAGDSQGFPEDSGGAELAIRREKERRHVTSTTAGLRLSSSTGAARWRAYGDGFVQRLEDVSPGVAPGIRDAFGLPESLSTSRYRRLRAGLQIEGTAGAATEGVIGAELLNENGTLDGTLLFGGARIPVRFDLDRDTRSLFAEGRLRLSDAVATQAGVRADRVDGIGSRFSGQLGARANAPGDRLGLSINAGTGFKPPSFFALGHPIVGNPALSPETSRSIEIATELGRPADAQYDRISAFATRYTNLVDFDAGPPPLLVNRSRFDVRGIALRTQHAISPVFAIGADVTWLALDLTGNADPIRNRPKLRASARAAWLVAPQWSVTAAGSWTGERFDSSIPTGGRMLSGFALFDVTAMYSAARWRASIIIDNVLDRRYETAIGFEGVRRRVRFEIATDL